MTTTCFHCGKAINEDSEENKGKRFLLCKHGCGYTAKGATHSVDDSMKNENTAINFSSTKAEKTTKSKQKKEVKMAKKKPEQVAATSADTGKSKAKGDGKKSTIVTRIKELMDKKTPEDIAETISREFGKKYNTNRVKETIKYIKRRAEKGKI